MNLKIMSGGQYAVEKNVVSGIREPLLQAISGVVVVWCLLWLFQLSYYFHIHENKVNRVTKIIKAREHVAA